MYNIPVIISTLKINNKKPFVFILAHVFSDAPLSIGETMLFSDYYDWLIFTIKQAGLNKDINWIVKPHPSSYIYNEDGRTEEKEYRVSLMKKVWSTPKNESDTKEKAWAFMQKIFARKTFEDVCDIQEIEEAEAEGNKKSANAARLTALYNMIGYGITGFCPELVNNRDELEAKIREYVICLQ